MEMEDQPDATLLDYVDFWISSGHTLKELADLVTKDTRPYDLQPEEVWTISGEMIRRYLGQQFGFDAVDERLTHARTRASYSMVDEAQSIADTVDGVAGEVAKARLRVSTRHWTAERFNPSAFGQKNGVSVNVSIGSLHLDALRSRAAKVTSALHGVATVLGGEGADSTQHVAIASVSAE